MLHQWISLHWHFRFPCHFLPTLPPLFILWQALKAVLDVCLNVLGEEVAGVALDGGAVLSNQELLKVPRDVCPPYWFPNQEMGAEKEIVTFFVSPHITFPPGLPGHQALRVIRGCWERLFEESEEWMLVLSIHLNLRRRLLFISISIVWNGLIFKILK